VLRECSEWLASVQTDKLARFALITAAAAAAAA